MKTVQRGKFVKWKRIISFKYIFLLSFLFMLFFKTNLCFANVGDANDGLDFEEIARGETDLGQFFEKFTWVGLGVNDENNSITYVSKFILGEEGLNDFLVDGDESRIFFFKSQWDAMANRSIFYNKNEYKRKFGLLRAENGKIYWSSLSNEQKYQLLDYKSATYSNGMKFNFWLSDSSNSSNMYSYVSENGFLINVSDSSLVRGIRPVIDLSCSNIVNAEKISDDSNLEEKYKLTILDEDFNFGDLNLNSQNVSNTTQKIKCGEKISLTTAITKFPDDYFDIETVSLWFKIVGNDSEKKRKIYKCEGNECKYEVSNGICSVDIDFSILPGEYEVYVWPQVNDRAGSNLCALPKHFTAQVGKPNVVDIDVYDSNNFQEHGYNIPVKSNGKLEIEFNDSMKVESSGIVSLNDLLVDPKDCNWEDSKRLIVDYSNLESGIDYKIFVSQFENSKGYEIENNSDYHLLVENGQIFTVSFETNGGSDVSSQQIAEGGVLMIPGIPTKKDRNFVGWYIDENLTTEYDFKSLINSNFTLYAKWKDEWVNPFEDVKETDWYYEDLKCMCKKGCICGKGNKTFGPNEQVTRAQMMAMVGKMNEVEEGKHPGRNFDDIDSKEYYTPYVNWGFKNKVVNGVGSGKFAPDSNITREDFTTILYRNLLFLDEKLPENKELPEDEVVFDDESEVSSYAKKAVKSLSDSGLIGSKSGKSFSPKSDITRAETVVLLKKFIDKFDTGDLNK
jgi:uncharacterized repeat protein (TIGR02543 family)